MVQQVRELQTATRVVAVFSAALAFLVWGWNSGSALQLEIASIPLPFTSVPMWWVGGTGTCCLAPFAAIMLIGIAIESRDATLYAFSNIGELLRRFRQRTPKRIVVLLIVCLVCCLMFASLVAVSDAVDGGGLVLALGLLPGMVVEIVRHAFLTEEEISETTDAS